MNLEFHSMSACHLYMLKVKLQMVKGIAKSYNTSD